MVIITILTITALSLIIKKEVPHTDIRYYIMFMSILFGIPIVIAYTDKHEKVN